MVLSPQLKQYDTLLYIELSQTLLPANLRTVLFGPAKSLTT